MAIGTGIAGSGDGLPTTMAISGPGYRFLPTATRPFSKFDGIAPRILSLYMPQFVRFEASYPSVDRLHWNARALDRQFLSGLEREAWDSITASVQASLTDEVIEDAVG